MAAPYPQFREPEWSHKLRRLPGVDLGENDHAWLILDLDGTPLGRLEVPRNMFITDISEDRVWVVKKDQLDVETVERHRLTRPRPSRN